MLCGSSEASEYMDSLIVQAIDADDNGIDIYEPEIDGAGLAAITLEVNPNGQLIAN